MKTQWQYVGGRDVRVGWRFDVIAPGAVPFWQRMRMRCALTFALLRWVWK